jgi:hypothetical protein
MSTGTFQIVALLLLLIAIAVLLLILVVVTRLQNELRPARPSAVSDEPEIASVEEATSEEAPLEATPSGDAFWDRDTEAAVGAHAFTSEVADHVDEVSPIEAATVASTVEPEPIAAEPVETVAHEDPVNQPFERDGRWYFRRGDELLVYDEATGQWKDAEEGAPTPSYEAETQAPAEVAPVTETDREGDPFSSGLTHEEGADPFGREETSAGSAGASTTGDPFATRETPAASTSDDPFADRPVPTPAHEAPAPEPAPAPTEQFWRCPSCGAINGATASTCRMCFTARP